MQRAREKGGGKSSEKIFFNPSNAKTYFLILRKGMAAFGSCPQTFLDNYSYLDAAPINGLSPQHSIFPTDWSQFSFENAFGPFYSLTNRVCVCVCPQTYHSLKLGGSPGLWLVLL